jgi:hypothetical protein
MRDTLRTLTHAAARQLEKWKLRGVYTDVHGNLDPEAHLREAAGWLQRAQDAGADRGVSYGAPFGGSFLASYPETTGYIIPTFLELADRYGNEEYVRRAVEMGDWEIAIQMDCGAVMGGRVDARPITPAVFNTGMVLLGWAALLERTKEDRFRQAGRRAADWLLKVQEPDGSWRKGNSQFAKGDATVYNAKAAWGLGAFGKACGDDRYLAAAIRNAEFALTRQAENGWFADCCLTDPGKPLLHTLAYTMQGVLEVGLLADRGDLVSAARKTADALIGAMDAEGYLPGRFHPDWSGAVSWCCLTGSAQTSIVWSRLHRLTSEARYREAAARVNRYLMARHDLTSPDPAIRGGVPGSWPVWGDYGRFLILNWATKFLVDALMGELESTVPGSPSPVRVPTRNREQPPQAADTRNPQ